MKFRMLQWKIAPAAFLFLCAASCASADGVVEVAADDHAGNLRTRVLREEHRLYPRALRKLAEEWHAGNRAGNRA